MKVNPRFNKADVRGCNTTYLVPRVFPKREDQDPGYEGAILRVENLNAVENGNSCFKTPYKK
jgi:hypothetical protein